jgi:hypothetical protein
MTTSHDIGFETRPMMTHNLFDEWYESRIDANEEENYKAGAWQFFTLSCDVNQTTGMQEQRIASGDLDAWICRCVSGQKAYRSTVFTCALGRYGCPWHRYSVSRVVLYDERVD